MLSKFLTNLYLRIAFKKKQRWKLTCQEECNILNSFPPPKTDIDRSYYQYKCQKTLMNTFERVFFELSSACLLIPTIVFLLLKTWKHEEKVHKRIVLPSFLQKRKLLPIEMINEKLSFGVLDRNYVSLNFDDLKFIKDIFFSHMVAFYFVYKCIWMIAVYSFAIHRFNPEIIVCSAEYSFTSSILTWYCEAHGINHYNVMHGEKLFTIHDAFSRFSKFFVWDNHYVKLFRKLKSMKSEDDFIIFSRTKLKIKQGKRDKVKYYLQGNTKKELERIRESLEKIGKEYIIRPHPLYFSKEVYEVFDKKCVESSREVSLANSLSDACIAISEDSTVLYQAFLCDIPIVIDDVTNPLYFRELKERMYIMLEKPHILLSEIIQCKGGIKWFCSG